ncbi:monooxygenase [Apiospora phragmitis]|uniref:Monooxygenase n=1 Tax=Apiospora phragmitis TaxID=2905665 RepID=A0ABR1TQD2_9PEZI
MDKRGYRDDYREDGNVEVIRANRHRLRDWLLHNLPVQNGKQAVQVEENDDKVSVRFRDGTSATGDLLVGADGVKSIEMMLTGYDPISIFTSNLRLEGEEMVEQLALGHSAYMVVLQGPDGVYYRYFVGLDKVAPDGKSADYYFHLAWPDEDAPRDDHWTHSMTAEEIRNFALQATQNLPPQFRCMVERAKLEDIKHVSVDWTPKFIVLRGVLTQPLCIDAMTPFLAQGAVHAIKDALSLGKTLTALPDSSRSTISSSMELYQEEMLTRGRAAAEQSKLAFKDPSLPKTMFARQVVSLTEDRITL